MPGKRILDALRTSPAVREPDPVVGYPLPAEFQAPERFVPNEVDWAIRRVATGQSRHERAGEWVIQRVEDGDYTWVSIRVLVEKRG